MVNHQGRFLHVAGPFCGAKNDKTAVKFDDFVMGIKEGQLYANATFELYTDPGTSAEPPTVEEHKGAYLIADGGYHRWRCLQCPTRSDTAASRVSWGKWVESVRKDVECAFGRLKGRFRCLKLPSRFQSLGEVDHEFRACIVLYNMCHFSDGRENRWDDIFEADPETTGALFGDDADGIDVSNSLEWVRERYQAQVNRHASRVSATMQIGAEFDASGVGQPVALTAGGDIEVESSWATLQAKLVRHFQIANTRKEVGWLF